MTTTIELYYYLPKKDCFFFGDLKWRRLTRFCSVIHIISVRIYKKKKKERKKERKSPLLILRVFEFHLRVLRGINIMMVVRAVAGGRRDMYIYIYIVYMMEGEG